MELNQSEVLLFYAAPQFDDFQIWFLQKNHFGMVPVFSDIVLGQFPGKYISSTLTPLAECSEGSSSFTVVVFEFIFFNFQQ